MHFSVAVMGSWGLFFFLKKKAAASLYYLSDLNVAYTTLLPGVTTLYRLKSWILLMVKAHTFLPTSRIRIFKRKFLGFRNVSLFFFFLSSFALESSLVNMLLRDAPVVLLLIAIH